MKRATNVELNVKLRHLAEEYTSHLERKSERSLEEEERIMVNRLSEFGMLLLKKYITVKVSDDGTAIVTI